ncbi:UDP-3-O-[3-hydroxymyristoyl] N-acetylglucosamine deacetylase [Rhodoblastus sphagnicola]|uniref:UDP-3-O-acyl-N-acetylglucosamine deacetylase n=1 Tax=Rhodoblastus sphagnicola TaxID=333368 RepID=A0A2S6N4V1_9HYPH|nr:UDP-3-O-acyl-N-acetylglucosamine deacetylase [Rhodoblastus sphagnicola]MBB4199633.1 UDP-3-O-[3-hydroxymyristoyl] N-acetylglucosamine deacetylase [Rhodoblastus sphagnicola]PPQ29640.1 UDP-3-O-[3-hydroxymyristoyl] N-acetylglucosamine deacetylase [Rhodoblastus sphagnicola]
MKSTQQTTLRTRVVVSGGIGVHSGKPVRLVLNPAEAGTGLVFQRTGLANGASRRIEARHSKVTMTDLCTVIGEDGKNLVATIEHLVAALRGLNIDNCLIEVDGPETPIMDGSAAAFVEAIDRAGVSHLDAPRRFIKILKTVRIEHGRGYSELRPADRNARPDSFRLDVEIDFDNAAIGRQRKILDLDPLAFRRELARARTFGFLSDVEKLTKMGFALGASLENSVGIDGDRILNPEGLRFSDEFVRHKMLDAVGDLALAGAPLIGAYQSYCGGHKMNVAVLDALFADKKAWRFVEAPVPHRAGARADLGLAVSPAFMPERG